MDFNALIKAVETLKAFGINTAGGINTAFNEARPVGNQFSATIPAIEEDNNAEAEDNSRLDEVIAIPNEATASLEKTSEQTGNEQGDIRVQTNTNVQEGRKSFVEALTGSSVPVPIKPIPPPRYEGGNVIVEVDDEDYEKEVRQCQFDVIGRIIMQKGDRPYSTLEIFDKLVILWGIQNFRIVPIGKGYFHVFLNSMDNQSLVLSIGALNLKPGIFRVSRWVPDFNSASQKQTNAQVWARLYDLPMEYRGQTNLFGIARGAGMPLKVDPLTLQRRSGLYCRVLLDVDLLNALPDKILVQRKSAGVEFFTNVVYEKLPQYCSYCGTIGHNVAICRRKPDSQRNIAGRPHRPAPVERQEQRVNVHQNNNGEEQEPRPRGELPRNMASEAVSEGNEQVVAEVNEQAVSVGNTQEVSYVNV